MKRSKQKEVFKRLQGYTNKDGSAGQAKDIRDDREVIGQFLLVVLGESYDTAAKIAGKKNFWYVQKPFVQFVSVLIKQKDLPMSVLSAIQEMKRPRTNVANIIRQNPGPWLHALAKFLVKS